METRCITRIYDEQNTEICIIYRQMDGHPDGHGRELAKFLKNKKVVDGYGPEDSVNFNGMGCLAAQLIAHLKTGIGNIYLYPAGLRDMDEEYTYFIRGKIGCEPTIEIQNILTPLPASKICGRLDALAKIKEIAIENKKEEQRKQIYNKIDIPKTVFELKHIPDIKKP